MKNLTIILFAAVCALAFPEARGQQFDFQQVETEVFLSTSEPPETYQNTSATFSNQGAIGPEENDTSIAISGGAFLQVADAALYTAGTVNLNAAGADVIGQTFYQIQLTLTTGMEIGVRQIFSADAAFGEAYLAISITSGLTTVYSSFIDYPTDETETVELVAGVYTISMAVFAEIAESAAVGEYHYAASASFAAVPEPTTVGFTALGAIVVLFGWRKRR